MPKAKYSHDLPPSLRRMQLSVPWSDTLRPRASVASWGLAFRTPIFFGTVYLKRALV